MAVTSQIVNQGTLTNTVATIRTGGATEHHIFTFYNTHSSAVIVFVHLNGSTHPVGNVELEGDSGDGGGFAIYECRIGSGDTVDAKASVTAVVKWSDEMDELT